MLLSKVISLEGCDYKVFAARESSQEQKRNKAIAVASFREAEDTLRYQQQLKAADPMVVDTEIAIPKANCDVLRWQAQHSYSSHGPNSK